MTGRPTFAPLRFALLVEDRPLSRWEQAVLEELRHLGVARLVAVVQRDSISPWTRVRRPVRRIAYYLLRALFARPTAWQVGCTVQSLNCGHVIHAKPVILGGAWEDLPAEVLEQLQDLDLDFVLRFGFGLLKGGVLEAARYGVWSHHHGDITKYRGRPAGFWEIATGSPIAGVVLQRLTTRLDGGEVLEQGWFKVDPWSWSATLDNVYWGAVGLVGRHCSRLLLEGRAPIAKPCALGPIYSLPDTLTVLRTVLSMTRAWCGWIAYGLFLEKRWSVGVVERQEGSSPWKLGSATWLRAPDLGTIADPFIFSNGGVTYIVCEHLLHPQAVGEIVRLELDTNGKVARWSTLLGGDGVHRSFPSLYRDSEGLWCIPEQSQRGELVAYRLAPDGSSVSEEVVLMSGFRALDPAVFRSNGRLWLAVTKPGPTANSVMYLFHASDLRGPWLPHHLNPVVTDVRCARPAGVPFLWNGQLFRPAQDCAVKYGGAIRLMRVDCLDPYTYEEEEIARLDPPGGEGGRDGIHTFSLAGSKVAIDACTHRSNPMAGLRRYAQRLRRARS